MFKIAENKNKYLDQLHQIKSKNNINNLHELEVYTPNEFPYKLKSAVGANRENYLFLRLKLEEKSKI